jgi:hypothetical protein
MRGSRATRLQSVPKRKADLLSRWNACRWRSCRTEGLWLDLVELNAAGMLPRSLDSAGGGVAKFKWRQSRPKKAGAAGLVWILLLSDLKVRPPKEKSMSLGCARDDTRGRGVQRRVLRFATIRRIRTFRFWRTERFWGGELRRIRIGCRRGEWFWEVSAVLAGLEVFFLVSQDFVLG